MDSKNFRYQAGGLQQLQNALFPLAVNTQFQPIGRVHSDNRAKLVAANQKSFIGTAPKKLSDHLWLRGWGAKTTSIPILPATQG
jgi:hypothetical protein